MSILIENGNVYDPLLRTWDRRTIGIQEGTIVDPAKIDAPEAVVDACGCVVSPGLIDYHLHLNADGCDGGVWADPACLPNGVTTAVDGGSCGESTYGAFHSNHVVKSLVRILSCLNVSSAGLASTRFPENLDPRNFAEFRIASLCEKHADELVGIKIRLSRGLIPDGDEAALSACLEIAGRVGLRTVAHATDPAIPSERIAELLRPGDVFCHAFHGTGDTIVDDAGRVKPGIRAARDRGVVFDACHGRVNFTFSTARRAIEDGFFPDVLSTDLSPKTLYKEPVISLPSLMSKFLALGCSLEQVFDMTVANPARLLGRERELASLAAGTAADIAVFRLIERQTVFRDWTGRTETGTRRICPMMTIRGGTIAWRSADL